MGEPYKEIDQREWPLPAERDPYVSAVKGRQDFRTAYRLQLENMRRIAAIVERCKKRETYQNSFIETDDLSTLEDMTQTLAGSKYRYNETQ